MSTALAPIASSIPGGTSVVSTVATALPGGVAPNPLTSEPPPYSQSTMSANLAPVPANPQQPPGFGNTASGRASNLDGARQAAEMARKIADFTAKQGGTFNPIASVPAPGTNMGGRVQNPGQVTPNMQSQGLGGNVAVQPPGIPEQQQSTISSQPPPSSISTGIPPQPTGLGAGMGPPASIATSTPGYQPGLPGTTVPAITSQPPPSTPPPSTLPPRMQISTAADINNPTSAPYSTGQVGPRMPFSGVAYSMAGSTSIAGMSGRVPNYPPNLQQGAPPMALQVHIILYRSLYVCVWGGGGGGGGIQLGAISSDFLTFEIGMFIQLYLTSHELNVSKFN